MKTRLKPFGWMFLCVGVCFSTAAYAQATGDATNNKSTTKAVSTEDQFPDLVELCPFGGISIFGQVERGLGTQLIDGGIGGIRVAVNPSKWVGLEGFFEYSGANVEFKTSSGRYPAGNGVLTGTPLPTYSFGSHNYTFGLDPVFNFRPRGSRFQPYVSAGIGGIQFTPTKLARSLAVQPSINALYFSGNLNDNLQVAFNYGAGIKFHLSDHFGLRIDAREFTSRNPTYDLPNFPDGGIYIPANDWINNFQATVGFVIYLGQSKCPPMPQAPPPPPPLPTPTISGGEGTICQGKPVTLHANLTAAPAGHTLSYAWTMNGAPSGSNSPDFTFTPNNVGSFSIQVTVTDTTPPPAPMERPAKFPVRCWVQPAAPPPVAPVSASATVTVNESAPQITSVTATPNALSCAANANGTHTANLTAVATSSACGGNLSYKWTVTEGSVTNDTTPNATFDSSTVNFEGGAQSQSKTVTATLTVTDETGKTASQTTTIAVNCEPQFVRLDDVVFAKNNARVNNCGKRILIDDAAPRVSGGDFDIVLVGHRDTDEEANAPGAPTRGRRARAAAAAAARALDEQRVLNAAAVLSGGTGTCGHVDPSRIKVDWVGADQTSDTRPGLCGTSNLQERKGSEVSAADKNRRVEVYLVPRNSQTMPPAVKNIKPLPEDQVKALACPK